MRRQAMAINASVVVAFIAAFLCSIEIVLRISQAELMMRIDRMSSVDDSTDREAIFWCEAHC
jgi:hypothetical protein